MEKVIAILTEICGATIIPNHSQNERYLHHYFSRKIQKYYPICYNDVITSKLHPEWPTSSAGFIDFAIGNYLHPEIAIEFKAGFGWETEGIVFDFMKLMDTANPFKECISFNIIYRDKGLSRDLDTTKVNEAKDIFIFQTRLGCRLAKDRKFQFWIVEIANQGTQKRIWYMDDIVDLYKNKALCIVETKFRFIYLK
jgi:hypothetical protein